MRRIASRMSSSAKLSSRIWSAPCGERLVELVEVVHLDLHDHRGGVGRGDAVEGGADPAGGGDVVVLDEDLVVRARGDG